MQFLDQIEDSEYLAINGMEGQAYADELRRLANEADRLDKFSIDKSFWLRARELRRHAQEIEKWLPSGK